MEKKKKSGLRKALLMVTASALVAAISVGLTLSYLTAVSNTKTNTFKSESDIDGKIDEPHFNMDQTNYFSPGERVDKDPTVKNTSSADADMWTGIRLKYYLNPSGTGEIQVDEATFRKFVEIYQTTTATDGKTGTRTTTTSTDTGYNTSSDDDGWTEMTSSSTTAITTPTASAGNVNDFSAAEKYDSLAKYFKYNTHLAKDANTVALFGSVQAKGDILIPASDSAKGTRDIKFDANTQWPASASAVTGYVADTAYSSLTPAQKRDFLSYVGDHLKDADTATTDYYFTSFDFKIKIDGYGVKYDSNDTGADELGDVIQKITDGLATITDA